VLSRAELSRTGVIFVALLLAVCATGAVAREFRAADTQTEDYPTVQALRHMGALVAERSSDRHEIKVFHSRQPGEEKETIEQTRAGAIDFSRTNVALIGSFIPAMNVLAMPFEDAMAAIYARAGRDQAAAALIERIRKVE
jgi:TRAP-type C4-dicarboxylate transport system substrate-binding protein